jgi:hypothetical protein
MAKTIQVQDESVAWDVTSNGEFFANFKEKRFTAPTLKGLTEQLRSAKSASPLNIPFVEFLPPSWSNATATVQYGKLVGVHSRNRNLLVKYADGTTAQKSRHDRANFLRGDADADKLQRLYAELVAAQIAYDEFMRANALEIPGVGKE